MKKVLSILVLALIAVQFAFAGDVITRDAKQLPLTARNFITKIERGRSGVEVELANDYSLKFNSKGKFVSMDD